MNTKVLFVSILCTFLVVKIYAQYQPNWDSIDSRPIPQWFDDAKIGLSIYWGVYSVPSFCPDRCQEEWFWNCWEVMRMPELTGYMEKNYPPSFKYTDFAPLFKAELYNPDQWADIIQASGAKYIAFTAKHHEGFTTYPSKYSWNWNSVDVGPKRDLMGDLANSLRNRTDVRFGIYYSHYEWFNPLYLADEATGYKTQKFVEAKSLAVLYEVVNTYKPELIWSDGDWEAPDTYWNSTQFLAWLYNESPVKDTIAVNDRWGKGIPCHHGGYYTCADHYDPGVLQKFKFENTVPLDNHSYGYRRNAAYGDYASPLYLITEVARTISCNGNVLINIGPGADGMIDPIQEYQLRELGAWLKVNGEGVYGTRPWTFQKDITTSTVWYTSKKSASGTSVYAISLAWPKGGILTLGAVNGTTSMTVSMLGYGVSLKWKSSGPAGGVDVIVPPIAQDEMPCRWAWVFKIDNLA